MPAADDDRDEPRSMRGFGDLIAGARPDDPAALVLAKARVAGALFGATAGLGRFRVLERLGTGGMGAVYAAYDPQLDRGVALKTVHVPAGGREAALAEAKALARLAHPNVVPVFDVGIEGDDVYIVMELVRGETLRRWVKGRPVRDVLDVYRQAGHALAAAHAAGLVHRDFKPDNAIVGVDGRVRVVDFGLACEASEARGSAAGTPGYMAPEQAGGGAVTPAADQYSFCIALAEALGDGELPRWIAAIIERGRAAEPGERFASITELVRALGRDPAKRRRRRLLAGSLVGLIAAAFVVGRVTPADHAMCDGGEAEIAQAWHPGARAVALARVALLGPYGRELAPRLAQQLSAHAQSWAAGRHEACVVHRRGMQSDALFDRRMACLDRSRAVLSTVADVVARSDAASLPATALAVQAIPDPAACGNVVALMNGVEPPPPALAPRVELLHAEIERARIEIAAGRLDAARTRIDATVAQARGVPYEPLLAEALLVAGQVMAEKEERDQAVPTLREASRTALAGQADAIAVEAWARRARLGATSDRFPDTLDGRDFIEVLATRPSSGELTRALLYSNIGSIELAHGQRAAARAAFKRARGYMRGVTGPGTVELAAIQRGLAIVTDDPGQRDLILAELASEQLRLLGPSHPETLKTRFIRATSSMVQLSDAAAILADTCEPLAMHTTLQVLSVQCWAQLGDVRRELGDPAGGNAALERAVQLGAATNHFTPEVIPTLSLWRGHVATAIRQFTAALDSKPRTPDEPWFSSAERDTLALGQARAYRLAGRMRDAHQVLQSVVAELEPIARDHPAMVYDRLLARARTELAYTGPRTDQTIAAARAAAAWRRSAGASPDETAHLERWITGTAEPDSPR